MQGLADLLVSGGPIVVLLLGLSLVSLTIIAAKLFQYAGSIAGEPRRQAALQSWLQGDRAAAIAAMAPGRTAIDRLMLHAMTGLQDGMPRDLLDDDLEWRGNAEVATLGRHIRFLELTAMVSPLLGLLGTVLGMIRAFQDLALAGGAANASLLATGIWQALLTTAVGLIVAIPAAIAAALFAARVEAVAQRIESAVGQVYAAEDRNLRSADHATRNGVGTE